MTTAVTRPHTVTVRIDTADDVPAPDSYTATVYMNTHRDNYDGYQPHHPLAAATRTDGSPLRLVLHTSDRIRSHREAASAVFDVGNRQRADDNGQTWPGDIRSVSVGDVIKITGPGHWIVHLSVDSCGFSPVPEPTHLTGLDTTARHTDTSRLAAALHKLMTDYPTDDARHSPDAVAAVLTVKPVQPAQDDGRGIAYDVPLQTGQVTWLTDLVTKESDHCRNAHFDQSGQCGHCGGTGSARPTTWADPDDTPF